MPRTYLDMDGVLARFEQAPNAMKRFAVEKGFFRSLAPTKFAQELAAIIKGAEETPFYILTASPNKQADADKIAWVQHYLPELADRVVIVRDGKDKAEFASGNYLVDDYTENLKFWTSKGGKGIKALNGINGKTGRYKEVTVNTLRVD